MQPKKMSITPDTKAQGTGQQKRKATEILQNTKDGKQQEFLQNTRQRGERVTTGFLPSSEHNR
jgi:hypothetical protein